MSGISAITDHFLSEAEESAVLRKPILGGYAGVAPGTAKIFEQSLIHNGREFEGGGSLHEFLRAESHAVSMFTQPMWR
jgi:hypothetical protein